MNIIRDNDWGGIAMIPLLMDWGIRRCNVKGCLEKPTTIVTQLAENVPACGFCEKHYQEANVPDGTNFTLVFDNYDAFNPPMSGDNKERESNKT